ncbi:MAG: hypothetical protein PHV07_04350 [Oscillospiraceae bacterium]|nr:hypothetical protein [Oscillospiraceae bacterium]
MKKLFAVVIALAIILVTFVGCSKNEPNNSSTPNTSTTAEGGLKTGLAIISTIESSKDAGEKDGLAQSDSTIIAVTVDSNGKITNCIIDAAQTKANFSAEGKMVTPLNTEFKTKMELGSDYDMIKASKIKKEWNEQASALASYVIGKTVSEVKGIAVNEKGVPTKEDLTASVTVSIGGFVSAIEKAVANAKSLGAKAGDKLGLGVTTNIEKSKDAGEKDGQVQVYSTYSAVTFGADNKITSCAIDASQNNVNFGKTGKITSDLAAEMKSKVELGNGYGMKGNSDISKEWFEQSDAFANYVVGKTLDEVKGIAVNDEFKTTDEELKASVTVSIGDFMKAIEKSSANAK